MNRIKGWIAGLDAFPKVDTAYLERTRSGGLLTIITVGLLSTLMMAELFDQLTPPLVQNYVVDPAVGQTTKMSLDISVASTCDQLVVLQGDVNGAMQIINDRVAMDEEDFDNIKYATIPDADLCRHEWSRKYKLTRTKEPEHLKVHGCRIKGDLLVGNAGGALLVMPLMSALGDLGELAGRLDESVNFSHLIHHLSFGEEHPEIVVNPLNGVNQLALQSHEHFTYFLSVIPTTFRDTLRSGPVVQTNQYALNGFKSKPGFQDADTPGLFFKFEHEPLALIITREETPWSVFFIRLIGIIGGIYNCSGVIHRIILAAWRLTRAALSLDSGRTRQSKGFDAGWSPVVGERQPMITKTVRVADDVEPYAEATIGLLV